MNDNWYRLLWVIVLITGLFKLGENIVKSQDKPITLDTNPHLLFCDPYHKTEIRTRITIAPHEDNRYLQLAWTAYQGESGNSLLQLDGDRAALTYTRWLKLDCDYYLLTACVLRTNSKRFCAKVELYPP